MAGPRGPRRALEGPGYLARADLQVLIDLLREDGRTVIGPTVADDAIVYDEVTSVGDLPRGVGDEQAPGRYRLRRRGDERLFGFVVGPTAWKKWTFPALVPLTTATKDRLHVSFTPEDIAPPRLAFLGARACELAALGIQDQVFTGTAFVDPDYAARRARIFTVAVQCTTAASTCFCTSMGTGPEVAAGYDLLLTELDGGFLVEADSSAGREILERLPLRPASSAEQYGAAAEVAAVRARIGDPVPASGLHDRLLAQLDHPRWAQVAERCITCGNCTLACPTCFCTTLSQVTDLAGTEATTYRAWDSCFSPGFAKVAGGSFRSRPRDRYRQWLTHKFATWWDQFGSSGCVGCGRCITWCPVGIDVRDELNAIAPAVPLVPEAQLVEPVAATPNDFVTARVVASKAETADTTTLTLTGTAPEFAQGSTGQFAMVALPGFPPLPISISRFLPDGIELTIRGAGPATKAMCALQVGEELGLRGPLGNNWPLDRAVGRDLVIVTGGIGLAPLRPVLHAIIKDRRRFGDVMLFYGARTPADLLYRDELERWGARDGIDVSLTVDRAGPEWTGPVGIVTHLFDQAAWDGSNMIAVVCGPERMMQATATTLAGRGVTAS
ncbi:MAG: 4Fe-4S dicluster domain-containing protein, partial [Chloroflexi bacterium]|nr:4Fe-4S dicluster domain-containing protein [Chloroflexota bacterium]